MSAVRLRSSAPDYLAVCHLTSELPQILKAPTSTRTQKLPTDASYISMAFISSSEGIFSSLSNSSYGQHPVLNLLGWSGGWSKMQGQVFRPVRKGGTDLKVCPSSSRMVCLMAFTSSLEGVFPSLWRKGINSRTKVKAKQYALRIISSAYWHGGDPIISGCLPFRV